MHKILLMVLNHRGDPSEEENSMSLERAKWAAAAAAAVLAIGGLALPGNALAQGAANVADFSCEPPRSVLTST